jgi:hypothetical protein
MVKGHHSFTESSGNCRIVVPIYKSTLSDDEQFSLSTIRKNLIRFGICFVSPASLDLAGVIQEGETAERFPDFYFSGIDGYNNLLKSSEFYERFTNFRHLLICQLDCLVLSDNLEQWISKGFDYIGAPWFKPQKTPKDGLWRVGNGGFSLRNIEAHLRVLRSKVIKGSAYRLRGKVRLKTKNASRELGQYARRQFWFRVLHPSREMISVEEEADRFPHFEDLFWSFEAPKFDESFKVPTPEEALPFAFEVAPRWCYEKNNRGLPFGCHAWEKYDRDFWIEILNDLKILGE